MRAEKAETEMKLIKHLMIPCLLCVLAGCSNTPSCELYLSTQANNQCNDASNSKSKALAFALALEHGKGLEKNEIEAMKWYKVAAHTNKGTIPGYVNLDREPDNNEPNPGSLDMKREIGTGHGSPGEIEAMLRLGLMYAEGRGTEKDMKKAKRWLKKAAEAGNRFAQEWLEKNKL